MRPLLCGAWVVCPEVPPLALGFELATSVFALPTWHSALPVAATAVMASTLPTVPTGEIPPEHNVQYLAYY
jgi:hypothetical protein